MIYKAPFYAMSKAIYGALSDNACTVGLAWFDASVPIDEIDEQFKGLEEFAYGVFGASKADCQSNKDEAVWEASISLDIMSNYKGRKVVAQKLEALLNYLNSETGWNKLQEIFVAQGFKMVSIEVGALTINPPLYLDIGVWQSGSTTISFKLNQI